MGYLKETDFKFDDPDIISISEFTKDLYFVTYKKTTPTQPKTQTKTHTICYFTARDEVNNEENSEAASRLSLGAIAQFIKDLNHELNPKRKNHARIVVNYATGSERKRCNASVLIGVYAITNLNMTVDDVVKKLTSHTKISPSDYLKSVEKAMDLGFVDFNTLNIEDFFCLDRLKLNWVVPNKFLMFAGPVETSDGKYLSPQRFVSYFHHVKVQTIIRLCHIKYDANPFVDVDISHYDLNISGSVPSDKMLEVFLTLSEESDGVVLVHCREYLGRAGCLVGAYLIKHYGMTAGEAVAWVRLCTSECILETQKTWLQANQEALLKAGEARRPESIEAVKDSQICERTEDAEKGDTGDVVTQFEEVVRIIDKKDSESEGDEVIKDLA